MPHTPLPDSSRSAQRARLTGLRRLAAGLAGLPFAAIAASPVCSVVSGAHVTPVIELYTSEGCSSCPPADQWLSSLKGQPVVAQAFHVAYWDYIGWPDRFANPAFTERQKDQAIANGLSGIYTPQVLRNGRDWRNWGQTLASNNALPARATISVRRIDDTDHFEAHITPLTPGQDWSAYWTVTEHGYVSRVRAGENAGATLQHNFVVRQYQPAGRFHGPQELQFSAIAAQAEHPRQINLVVSDGKNGETLQAVSLQCL